MTEDVSISDDDRGVREIVLRRADAGNALTPAMAQAIGAAMADPPPSVRAILLRALGPDFCTGRSPVMPEPGTRMSALDLRERVSDPVLDFYAAMRSAPVPVVAAVQGRAVGVGCALAALADVAVAGRGATFVVPEMDRDIAPTLVMNALCDRLGRAALARMVLTRDRVGAEEARSLGLVGLVAEDDDPTTLATRIVDKLRENSPATVRAVKSFLSKAPESSQETRKELAALLNAVAAAEGFK